MKRSYKDLYPHVPQFLTLPKAFGFLARNKDEPEFAERWSTGNVFISEAEPATDVETAYYQQSRDTSAMVVDINSQEDYDKYVTPYLT